MVRAGWLWAGPQLRRRWRSVAVLALITALAGGAAMAAATGARRSVVVIDEVMAQRLQPDVLSLPSRPGFDWSQIVTLPYVESYELFAVSAMCLAESGGVDGAGAVCGQPPVAGGAYESIDRHDVIEGRLPERPDEIAINWLARDRYGWEVGQRLALETIGAGNLDQYWSGAHARGEPWGPVFEVTVTGVVVGHDAWRLISGGVPGAGILLSTEFIPAHGDQLDYRVDAFLRLRGGEADIPRLRADLARITGDPAVPVRNVHEAKRRVQRSTSTEAAALWLFAGAAAALVAVLAGQALARLVRAGAEDAPVLRALGMTRPGLAAALAVPGLAAAGLGAAGSAVLAVALSPLVPIGMAGSFDRHPGLKLDLPVLATGALGAAVVLGLVTLAAGYLAAGRAPVRAEPSGGSLATPRLVAAVRSLRLPLPVELGVRLALERRPGGDSVPVRAGLVGVVVAVAAVVAVLTFRAGLAETAVDPARAGQVWDVALLPGIADEALTAEPHIVAAAEVGQATVTVGALAVPAFARRPVVADLDLVVLAGRLPAGEDEIALGPSTAATLGATVGHTLPAGPQGTTPVRVVGLALTPEVGGHSAYDEGAWLTVPGLERLQPAGLDWASVFIQVSGEAGEAELDALAGRLDAAGAVVEATRFADPAGISNLERTRDLPTVLSVLFAVIGLGTVGHTLVITVRRRQRDLAVLRALGLTPRQVRAAVAWAAATLAATGVLIGAPLGVVAGRLAWQWVATAMPLVHVPPSPWLAVSLTAPVALTAALLAAGGPAQAATTTPPGLALRAG